MKKSNGFSHSITIFSCQAPLLRLRRTELGPKKSRCPPGLEGSAARAAPVTCRGTDVGGDVAGLWRGECSKCNWDEKDRERLGRLGSRLEKDWRVLAFFEC